jgi:hypothetical protein
MSEKRRIIMKLPYLVVLVCLLFASTAFADEKSHRQAAEELLAVSDADSIMDQMQEQVKGMFSSMVQDMDIPPEKRGEAERYMNRLGNLMAEEMSWEKMKEPMIEVYVAVYTEDELREVTAFYRSSIGQKVLAKMPQLIEESMRIAQEQMKDVLPKIQALGDEMVAELRIDQ